MKTVHRTEFPVKDQTNFSEIYNRRQNEFWLRPDEKVWNKIQTHDQNKVKIKTP